MSEMFYAARIVETFGERAMRSAYIIDDQFPTYSDLAKGEEDHFAEKDIALSLHEYFRGRGIPCDVENMVGGQVSDEHIDRIRKTDLIVLDYNLDGANQNDGKTAIDILGRLADSAHFNTVVLYTKARELDRVWEEVVGSLKGGWDTARSERHVEVETNWRNGLNDRAPDVPKEIRHAALRGVEADADVARNFRAELHAASTKEDGSPTLGLGDLTTLIEELARLDIRTMLQEHHEDELTRSRDVVANCSGRTRWLLVGQCFVAVMGKPNSEHEEKVSPDHIMEMLHAALADWRPSLLQIVVAQIQNILEQKPLATEAGSLSDPELHVGLIYYLLWSLPREVDEGRPDELSPFVSLIVGKLVENIRRRVMADADLNSSAVRMLLHELARSGRIPVANCEGGAVPAQAWKRARMFAAARDMSNVPKRSCPNNENALLLKLNALLSAETFDREGVTTGTVFSVVGDEQCYICLTPACDMVPRPPIDGQKWMRAMHPVRPLTAVRLHEHVPPLSAIGNAEHGRHVFVEHAGRGIRSFSVFDATNGQPVVETIFASDAARASAVEGSPLRRFSGQVLSQRDGRSELADAEFDIIGQVRENYASRLLDMLGHHVSRIGVDFVGIEKQDPVTR